MIENVTGLITSHDGADFAAIYEAMVDAGYNVGAVVIDAELFVPQSRPRLFMIGVDKALPIPAGLSRRWTEPALLSAGPGLGVAPAADAAPLVAAADPAAA